MTDLPGAKELWEEVKRMENLCDDAFFEYMDNVIKEKYNCMNDKHNDIYRAFVAGYEARERNG